VEIAAFLAHVLAYSRTANCQNRLNGRSGKIPVNVRFACRRETNSAFSKMQWRRPSQLEAALIIKEGRDPAPDISGKREIFY
jgi:hypothetical protein